METPPNSHRLGSSSDTNLLNLLSNTEFSLIECDPREFSKEMEVTKREMGRERERERAIRERNLD